MNNTVYSQKSNGSNNRYETMSQCSRKSGDNVSVKSQTLSTKTLHVDDTIESQLMKSCWNSFGYYISRQLRMGRGIHVPKLGHFNFSAPEITLSGVTNPEQRDKQYRFPIFMIGQDFASGLQLKSGIATEQGLRPYVTNTDNGKIAVMKINYTEIGMNVGLSKDDCKQYLERVYRQLSDKVKLLNNAQLQIPNVGLFIVKQGVAAVAFNEFLRKDTLDVNSKPLPFRLERGSSTGLTVSNLQKFLQTQSMIGSSYGGSQQGEDFYLKSTKQSLKSRGNSSKLSQSISNQSLVSVDENGLKKYRASKSTRLMSSLLGKSNSSPRNFDDGHGLRQLKYWINTNNLGSDEAFTKLVTLAYGACNENSKLSLETLNRACEKLELNLDQFQVSYLFNALDKNSDGYVDYSDWIKTIKEGGNYIQKIRDLILKSEMKNDQILRCMGISKEQGIINIIQLRDAFKRLDRSMTDEYALKISKFILKDKDSITVNQFTELFEINDNGDSNQFDLSWFNGILSKLKRSIMNLSQPDALRRDLQQYEQEPGLIDNVNFKNCLLSNKLGLSINDVNKMVLFLDKSGELIDYKQFMNKIDKKQLQNQSEFFNDLMDFVQQMHKYLKNNHMTIGELIKQAQNFLNVENISVDNFTVFLQKNLFQDCELKELAFYTKSIDIDKDGFVSKHDLGKCINKFQDCFMKRSRFFETVLVSPSSAAYSSGFKKTKIIKKLVPQKNTLTVPQIDQIIMDIRFAMKEKFLNDSLLFKLLGKNIITLLDNSKDGFITFDEFNQEINKVINIAPQTKELFFKYLDNNNMGMIDFNRFKSVINKSIFSNVEEEVPKDDNFEWVDETLKKIKKYFKEGRIPLEDGFRSIDKDFDGFISKDDLYQFITEVLEVKPEDIVDHQMDRLFKLFDIFKRNRIQFIDFKTALQDDNLNMTIGGNKKKFAKRSQDWKVNARQQLGIYISKHYESLEKNFEILAERKDKIVFQQFKRFVDDNHILKEFKLNDNLLMQFYADLDPHKKGFLSLSDWVDNFGGYNWIQQMIDEIQVSFASEFKSYKEAFLYLSQENEQINLQSFFEQMKLLFPQRYKRNEIQLIWEKISGQRDFIDFETFSLLFDKNSNTQLMNNTSRPKSSLNSLSKNTIFLKGLNKTFGSSMFQKSSSPQRERQKENPYYIHLTDTKEEIFDKLRKLFQISKISVDVLFEQLDKDKIEEISYIEFRHILRDAKTHLTQGEMDIITHCFDKHQTGIINITDFRRNIAKRPIDNRIHDRISSKIRLFRHDLYKYLISPMDQFKNFNEEKDGKLTFPQFMKLTGHLCKTMVKNQEEHYPYQVCRDLFDYIDIRKDGVIDKQEWLQTFISTVDGKPDPEDELHPMLKPPHNNDVLNVWDEQRPLEATRHMQHMNYRDQFGLFIKKDHKRYADRAAEKKRKAEAPVSQVRREEDCIEANTRIAIDPDNQYESYKENLNVDFNLWEQRGEYEQVVKIIARNRKFLINLFSTIEKQEPLTPEKCKNVIAGILKQGGIVVKDKYWPVLINFAIKDGVIDYEYLLEIYKQKISR